MNFEFQHGRNEETTVGRRLKAWRKSSALTLVQLSKKIGVSQGSLSDLENDNSLPSATTLAQLCRHTDLNICWILTGQEPVQRTVEEGEIKSPLYAEFIQITQDRKLKDLVEMLIRIYRRGDFKIKAKIEGFLIGANPE